MSKKDLFYGDVEGRMEELKQKPITKEKETRGEKINKSFSIMLGTCYYHRFDLHPYWFVEVVL